MLEHLKRIVLGLTIIVGIYIACVFVCVPLVCLAVAYPEWTGVLFIGILSWSVGTIWKDTISKKLKYYLTSE